MNVLAIVVLFNPKLNILERLYLSLYGQVNSIVFVDNSEDEGVKEEAKNWLNQFISRDTIYLDLGKNHGIAYAQNRGIEIAKEREADFVLLLDQDSALPNNMVSDLMTVYKNLVTEGYKVATVGPSFLDEKTNELAKIIRHQGLKVQQITPEPSKTFMIADYIISSGSLVPMKVLEDVGVMDEQLFIDWVDIEWGIRAKQHGYDSYVAPKVIMLHSIGDEYVNFRNKNINLHSDFRHYFIVRNNIYLTLYSNLPMNFRMVQISRTPLHILFYSYHSKRRLYSLKLLTKAVADGIFKNMGKGHFK